MELNCYLLCYHDDLLEDLKKVGVILIHSFLGWISDVGKVGLISRRNASCQLSSFVMPLLPCQSLCSWAN